MKPKELHVLLSVLIGLVVIAFSFKSLTNTSDLRASSGNAVNFTFPADLKADGNSNVGNYTLSTDSLIQNQFFKYPEKHWNVVLIDLSAAANLKQLAGLLGTKLKDDSAAFFNFMTCKQELKKLHTDPYSLQTYLLPQCLEVAYACTPAEFVSKLQSSFYNYWSESRIMRARSFGLSPKEVVTLSTIVCSETWECEEWPKIAGLYINRLQMGMRLQADPTVIFACRQKDPGCRIIRVQKNHLCTQSPYNTYLTDGLPPAPICAPRFEAIEAVLQAQNHDFIYMVANPDSFGYHTFSTNLEEHRQNREKYVAWLEGQNEPEIPDSLLTLDFNLLEDSLSEPITVSLDKEVL